MNTEQATQLIETIKTYVIEYGLKAIGGIVFVIFGLWIASRLTKMTRKLMTKNNVDPALIGFITSLVGISLKILVIISAMGIVGIEMTSFIAILGAAGLAIGLALQGTLQNFAGGTLILILKPYKIGDYISVEGHEGVVKEIQIFNTILRTLDNKVIIIPNGSISTTSLVNFTAEEIRRVDFSFGVAYGTDFKVVRDIIKAALDTDPRILKDPEAFIGLGEMADSSVNITTRAWVNTPDYWDVFFDTNKNIYTTFNEKGIVIPFPQMDLHIEKE